MTCDLYADATATFTMSMESEDSAGDMTRVFTKALFLTAKSRCQMSVNRSKEENMSYSVKQKSRAVSA